MYMEEDADFLCPGTYMGLNGDVSEHFLPEKSYLNLIYNRLRTEQFFFVP